MSKVQIGIGHTMRALHLSIFGEAEIAALREALISGDMNNIEFIDDVYSRDWSDNIATRKAAEAPEYIGQYENEHGELVGGYKVLDSTYVQTPSPNDIDKIVKVGHNPEAPEPWGTWVEYIEKSGESKGNHHGHYWNDEDIVGEDYRRRINQVRQGITYDHTNLIANMNGYETDAQWKSSEEYSKLHGIEQPQESEIEPTVPEITEPEQSALGALEENEHVKELLGILDANGKDSEKEFLTTLLSHCKNMETFCTKAEASIAEMKSQLDEMKELQNPLDGAVKELEARTGVMRQVLSKLKASIIETCKKVVTAFREKGVVALDNLSSRFGAKEYYMSMAECAKTDMKVCDKAIAKINAFSREYHKTVRDLKNMGRIMVGKIPVDTVKEPGKLAKLLCKPYIELQKSATASFRDARIAIISLDKRAKEAQAIRDRRSTADKPSLRDTLKENGEKAARQNAATPERTVDKEVERQPA